MVHALIKHSQMTLLLSVVVLSLLFAGTSRADTPRILAIGDSLMASHSVSGRSIADYLARELGQPVKDRSVLGAHMVYNLPITGAMGMSIPAQFKKRDTGLDWVVMTGGGNDLWLGCGCGRCDRRMNKLISKDGTRGKIPSLMAKIRRSGAQVAYVGYLRSPGMGSPIEHCKDDGDELEARIAKLAARDEGIHLLSNQDLVKPGDRSYFAFDMIHPSVKASRMIAARLAALIEAKG